MGTSRQRPASPEVPVGAMPDWRPDIGRRWNPVHAVVFTKGRAPSVIREGPATMDRIHVPLVILSRPLVSSSRPGWTVIFWLNILSTIVGFIPGNVHAISIIAKR